MKASKENPMPPEYEHLNGPLFDAREHVHLIDLELERMERQANPLDEMKTVKLQEERRTIINNLKNEFEMQTWEDGPARTEEIHKIVDRYTNAESYKEIKESLLASEMTYDNSHYWADKYGKNVTQWHEHYGKYNDPTSLDGFDQLDLSDDYDCLDMY